MKSPDIKTEILFDTIGENKCIVHYPVITTPSTPPFASINNFSHYFASDFFCHNLNNVLTSAIHKNSTASLYWQLMFYSRFIISYKYEGVTFDEKGCLKNIIFGAVWNTRTGSAYKLKDFFKNNVRHKEIILYVLTSKIKEKISRGEAPAPDWLVKLYSSFDYLGYYLCKEGFVFVLPYDIFPGDTQPEILISYMELKNQLNLKQIM